MADPRSPVPYGTPNYEWFGALRGRTDDGPVLMVNLMRYHERAQYADGSDGGASGKEADDRYAPVEVLADIGARVMLHGDVVHQAGAQPRWDRIGIVEYPSRWEFVKMQQRPDFAAKHEHKAAGMKETIVMACLPRALARAEGDRPEVLVMEVVRRTEAGDAAVLDLPLVARLDVEATVLGDGRQWHEVRFYAASTAEVEVDATADAAESFVMVVRPGINRFR